MPIEPAPRMAAKTDEWLARVSRELKKIETLRNRLRDDANFQDLWNRDSAQALRDVGINPDARTEVGLEPYADAVAKRGVQCNNCITPMGNACHC
jgi:hypothetical protein